MRAEPAFDDRRLASVGAAALAEAEEEAGAGEQYDRDGAAAANEADHQRRLLVVPMSPDADVDDEAHPGGEQEEQEAAAAAHDFPCGLLGLGVHGRERISGEGRASGDSVQRTGPPWLRDRCSGPWKQK